MASSEAPGGAAAGLVWRVTARQPAADFGIMRVRRQHATHPVTGEERVFSVIEGPDWVNVIALTAADEVVLVRQFRHGTERVTLEVPGGCVDPGESALAAAQRELREETGFVAPNWRGLGYVEPNPAIQTNACHFFLAWDAEQTHEQQPDPTEVMLVERRPLRSIQSSILSGEVSHSLVVAAFGVLLMHAGGWRRPELG